MINIYYGITLDGLDTVGEFTLRAEVGFRHKSTTPEFRFMLDNEKYFWTRPVELYPPRGNGSGWTVSYGSGGEESCWPDEISVKAKGEALMIAAKIVGNLNLGRDAIAGLTYLSMEQCFG
jgi:hypothetical protein